MRNTLPAIVFAVLALPGFNVRSQGPAGAPNTPSAQAIHDNKPDVNAKPAAPDSAGIRAPAVKLSSNDQEFFQKAGASGLAEVAAGQMADQQGGDEEVKTFGRQMVRDHTKANNELNQLAANKGVTLPAIPDPAHRKMLDGLKQKESADFDKTYIKGQVKDHKEAVGLFGKAANSKDPDIAAFAGKTLPVLKEHLTMIKALDAKSQKR